MITADSILQAIANHEPELTNWALDHREGADRHSVQAASISSLAISTIAYLNAFDLAPPRSMIDTVVQRLPGLMTDELVRLDHAILDRQHLLEAKKEIFGANSTTGPTAISLIYNARVTDEVPKMLAMTEGPLGPLGGIVVIVGSAMHGESFEDFLGLTTILLNFSKSLSQSSSDAQQTSGTKRKEASKAVVACPYCDAKLSLPKGKQGTVRCPKCREAFEAQT